jgi:hypothetical protein
LILILNSNSATTNVLKQKNQEKFFGKLNPITTFDFSQDEVFKPLENTLKSIIA